MEEQEISSTLQWRDVSLPPSVTEAELDEAILATAERNWRKMAYIVGTIVQHFQRRPTLLDAEIIAARIQELAKRGQIESQGNLQKWRFSEVRLPPSS
jgi:hypothetical protein